jgi:hypothetical protein
MNSKVLLVGAPSDALHRALSGEFWIQTSPTAAESLSLIPKTGCVMLICCIESEAAAQKFLHDAERLRPQLPSILMVRDGWREFAVGSNSFGQCPQCVLLPASTNPDLVRLNARQLIEHQARRSEQKELLSSSVTGTVSALFEVLSIVDPYSASLGQRLRYAVDLFCKSARVEMSWELETGALLAEIGVLTIPVRVVMKHHSGQDLSAFEKDMVSHIPERGADLLQQIPSFAPVASIVRYQSKNFDGTGLPADSLAGDRLPFGARILKVLNDLFRLKENGKPQEEAIAEMESRDGRYDPRLLQIAKHCFDVSLPSKISASTLPLQVKDLRPGQLLVSSVETDEGVLLIRDGQVISPQLLHKLRNFAFTSGIKEPIYVIDLLESRKMTSTFRDIANGGTSFFVKAK